LAQYLPTVVQGLRCAPVGEEARVAEADEACWEHMEQEASEEGMGVHGRHLELIALAPVAVGEGDLPVVHLNNAVVGNRHTVRVPAEILHDLGRPGEGTLGVDNPFLGRELVEAWHTPLWKV
jgi:hypothetical protein